ncbi:hypothetical protein BU17DRAFT_77804 [Hysterangium stoloniferum]|nr:hypothetical protein BU17DRAFT_77804 [Hysterangium stoloniferum]
MGGFMLFDGQETIATLSPNHFERLLRLGKIQFPTITEEEIQDRSKGDALSKGLVIVQTTWFIVQCIARKAQGLDTTQIELLTLALATLNGVMYFLWWDKPLGVRCPVSIHLLETRIDPIALDESQDTNDRSSVEYGWMRVPSLYALPVDTQVGLEKLDILPPVLGTVFGAIHCIAWFYTFPTYTEALLWRVCSILVTTIPGLFSTYFVLVGVFEFDIDGPYYPCLQILLFLLPIPALPAYILARFGLLVEAVIALRALPPKAYMKVDWTSFLPHI